MIRRAEERDVADILRVYAAARAFMRRSGNHAQWTNGYPSEEIVRSDIARGISWVLENEGHIAAVFALIPGDDPTYAHIEGAWRDDSPYATIHRAGSDVLDHLLPEDWRDADEDATDEAVEAQHV